MKRDRKTTGIGITMLIAFLGLTAALIFKKIDGSTYAIALSSVGAFATVFLGLFSADSKKRLNDQ